MTFRPRLGLVPVVLSMALAVYAQQGKRPLAHGDYDGWKSISSPQLSRDGKFLAYGLFPQDGDGLVVVRELATGKEWREAAGALPPPPASTTDEPDRTPRGVRLAFTRDGRFLVSTTFPSKGELAAARKARKKPEEMPKGGLLIVNTSTGAATRVADVKSMQVPEKGGALVAYLKEAKPASAEEKKAEEKKAEAAAPAARANKKEYGSELVLRDLEKTEGGERTFASVMEYALAKDGATMLYAVSSRKEEENGVYAVETAGGGAPVPVMDGKGKYSKLAWDRENKRAAFLSDRDEAAAKQPRPALYLWERRAAKAAAMAAATACSEGYVLSDKAAVSFSRDGSRVFAGCAPPREPEPDTSAAPAENKVVADLWHWRDDLIQPMQKVLARRERDRTYTAVYHIAEKKFLQLADRTMRTVSPSDDGRYALGADDSLYRRMVDYDGHYADQYVVDTRTGARRRVIEKMRAATPQWSPDGKYAAFFRDKQWHTLSIPEGTLTTITSSLEPAFFNEDDDRAEPASNYGWAGWTNDSRWVLLYDRYDVWQVAADGRTARNVTEGFGRRNKLQLRVVRLDSEEDEPRRGIDPEKPVLLRAENLETRETGFFRDRMNSDAAPEKLIMGAKNFRTVVKAREADVIALTASTFHEFPDLQITDGTFAKLDKVTDANPQKAGLLWGRGELIRYKNTDGVALQAALYKPEGFDPAKKYPLMVNFYERMSQTVHTFVDPRPGTSINISYYVSNGYVVLTPDIVYTVGSPGQSALKAVLPAIQAVADQGYIDENAIGIQGHSWGGYQIAYMLGHTRRFRAAEAGAPVANMFSAYNGIRWGSGMPRQFLYEQSQSRIGGTPWERPMEYLENSPIFSVNKVETPVLIIHDDQDDAVPWYQGIEWFLSLRRLGKEAYLFNYNGEVHNLRQRQNQKDYTVRMQQFFDHFLKGAPAPEWMRKGIPYIDREAEKERFSKTFSGAGQ
ncbi:MAG TPA: prolyl oligopeptidase family serine peptidase [Bryobacteraceae bacterium]|nr:prolyl oligopeptidase family serine peptidase [Bryobacteraceae bacterium]